MGFNETLKSKARKCLKTLPYSDYRQRVNDFYELAAEDRDRWIEKNMYYYSEHYRYMQFLIPDGMKVLELGSGTGRLLNAIKPAFGVGVDVSQSMIEFSRAKYPHLDFKLGDIEDERFLESIQEKFDYIIISDTIGYLKDCQQTLENLHRFCTPETRIIISYYSWLWEPVLRLGEKLGQKMPQPQMNWLSTDTIVGLLELADFKMVKREWRQLLPKKTLGIGGLVNKYVGTLPIIRRLCLRNYVVARSVSNDILGTLEEPSVSIAIPCRNEEGNIKQAIKRIPNFCRDIEIIFVEGNSQDNTEYEIRKIIQAYPEKNIKMYVQDGVGKWDAVSKAFSSAKNDILMILDADLTTPPEELPKFYNAIASGKGEFINGSRLIYPMENDAMRTLNRWANSLFSFLFTWILNQRYTDTLCGTKVLSRRNYEKLLLRCSEYADNDPFGDFFLIFGAQKENLHTVEIPIRYAARGYGETQISRFKHGLMLAKMVLFSYRRFKAF